MMGLVLICETSLTAARKNAIVEITENNMSAGIEKHTKNGMDFMTVHYSVMKRTVKWIKRSDRLIDVVSRGGFFLTVWILHNEIQIPARTSERIQIHAVARRLLPTRRRSWNL